MIFRYKIKFISDIEQKIRKLLVNIAVTPFVGVWIEVLHRKDMIKMEISHSLRGSVDWSDSAAQLHFRSVLSHSLRGSVDWNMLWLDHYELLPCHSLRGSVDWNLDQLDGTENINVTPFVGVWIEITTLAFTNKSKCLSLPSWECGLKYFTGNKGDTALNVTPFVGVWIEILEKKQKT